MKQLDLFDIEREEPIVKPVIKKKRLELLGFARVTATPSDYPIDPEDQYYISSYTGKRGKIVTIHKGINVSFELEFTNGQKAWFYETELTGE
jgi:hypothetical protein